MFFSNVFSKKKRFKIIILVYGFLTKICFMLCIIFYVLCFCFIFLFLCFMLFMFYAYVYYIKNSVS